MRTLPRGIIQDVSSGGPITFIAATTTKTTTALVPPGTLAGDFMIMAAEGTANVTVTGWTLVAGPTAFNFSSNHATIYTRVADASDAVGFPANTKTYTLSTAGLAHIDCYRNLAGVLDVAATPTTVTSGTAMACPTVTTGHNNELIWRCVASNPVSGLTTFTWPTSSKRTDTNKASGDTSMTTADIVQPIAGSAGTETATASVATQGAVKFTLAFT